MLLINKQKKKKENKTNKQKTERKKACVSLKSLPWHVRDADHRAWGCFQNHLSYVRTGVCFQYISAKLRPSTWDLHCSNTVPEGFKTWLCSAAVGWACVGGSAPSAWLGLETSRGPFQPARLWLTDPVRGRFPICSLRVLKVIQGGRAPHSVCCARAVEFQSGSYSNWFDERDKSLHCC